jgi:hypothetical protein
MTSNQNERKGPGGEAGRKDPGEAQGDGRAQHGYQNEVSWDGGKGGQPYANQGDAEQGPATAKETEGGNRGEASGRNLEQLEELKRRG